MKVGELLEILKTCDQEAEVETAYTNDGPMSGEEITDVMQVEVKVEKRTVVTIMRE